MFQYNLEFHEKCSTHLSYIVHYHMQIHIYTWYTHVNYLKSKTRIALYHHQTLVLAGFPAEARL